MIIIVTFVDMWIPIIGCIIYWIWKQETIARNKEEQRHRDLARIKQWRDAGYPEYVSWSKGLSVTKPGELKDIIDQDVEMYSSKTLKPSVLTTKEFVIPKSSGYILPKIDRPTEWFIGQWGIGKPSPAEQKIIDELVKYNIHWEREVSFRGLILPSGGYARYDIYLPDHNLCIEYQGRDWHNTPEKIETDCIKRDFCKDYKIKLLVWHSYHYHKMEETVALTMSLLQVSRISL